MSEEEALVIPEPLDQTSTELIRSQLEQLNQHGYGLEDARTQCLIIYFKIASSLQLNYDPDFCDVSSPENVWKMLQVPFFILIFRKNHLWVFACFFIDF